MTTRRTYICTYITGSTGNGDPFSTDSIEAVFSVLEDISGGQLIAAGDDAGLGQLFREQVETFAKKSMEL